METDEKLFRRAVKEWKKLCTVPEICFKPPKYTKKTQSITILFNYKRNCVNYKHLLLPPSCQYGLAIGYQILYLPDKKKKKVNSYYEFVKDKIDLISFEIANRLLSLHEVFSIITLFLKGYDIRLRGILPQGLHDSTTLQPEREEIQAKRDLIQYPEPTRRDDDYPYLIEWIFSMDIVFPECLLYQNYTLRLKYFHGATEKICLSFLDEQRDGHIRIIYSRIGGREYLFLFCLEFPHSLEYPPLPVWINPVNHNAYLTVHRGPPDHRKWYIPQTERIKKSHFAHLFGFTWRQYDAALFR